MRKLEGKVIIINGAGPGMGRAVAELFAINGAKVVACDINEEKARGTAESIKEKGGEAIYIVGDATDLKSVKAAVKMAVDTYGTIDILYNNAGLQGDKYWKNILDVDPADAYRSMDVNYKSYWNFMYCVAPYMKKQNKGSIVNLASVAGVKSGGSTYGGTKGGVIHLTRCVAGELGKYNIRCNSVSPGSTITPIIKTMEKWFAKKGYESTYDYFASTVPLRKPTEVDDVAQAVLFLASDESKGVNAFDLRVDSGACINSQPVVEEDYVKDNQYTIA